MSLRPNFAGFQLASLRSLSGCKDPDKRDALVATYDRLVEPHEEQTRVAAHAWIDRLVSGELAAAPPAIEPEELQHVVIALAQHEQELVPSTSLYWEAFMGALYQRPAGASPAERQLARYFLQGRPLFGDAIQTSWAYYAWLPHDQLDQLERLMQHERYRALYDHAAARQWLATIIARELDLFFYAY
ncbi:MAG TPA: hypothetical protein VNO30_18495 [Kofleriaceae bacterium]|nr:hypothetical protein [Kofleriaceae bacterium]